jgi:hypothetical protein
MTRLFATCLLIFLFSGCHTVPQAEHNQKYDVSGLKVGHVVMSARKDRGFDEEIERVLRKRGVKVTKGDKASIPADADFYVIYEDKWKWDMIMYPAHVTISFRRAKTDEVIGSAKFDNSFFHTFADPPEITEELIGRIYGEAAGTYMK